MYAADRVRTPTASEFRYLVLVDVISAIRVLRAEGHAATVENIRRLLAPDKSEVYDAIKTGKRLGVLVGHTLSAHRNYYTVNEEKAGSLTVKSIPLGVATVDVSNIRVVPYDELLQKSPAPTSAAVVKFNGVTPEGFGHWAPQQALSGTVGVSIGQPGVLMGKAKNVERLLDEKTKLAKLSDLSPPVVVRRPQSAATKSLRRRPTPTPAADTTDMPTTIQKDLPPIRWAELALSNFLDGVVVGEKFSTEDVIDLARNMIREGSVTPHPNRHSVEDAIRSALRNARVPVAPVEEFERHFRVWRKVDTSITTPIVDPPEVPETVAVEEHPVAVELPEANDLLPPPEPPTTEKTPDSKIQVLQEIRREINVVLEASPRQTGGDPLASSPLRIVGEAWLCGLLTRIERHLEP